MDCDVTYEELARFAAADLDAGRARDVAEHAKSCGPCRRRLDAVRAVDAGLRALPRAEPPAAALLRTRRLLSDETRGTRAPEIMTLDEVAEFLRISLDDLEEIVLELPAFELAGQLRVRRARLIEWVEEREQAYGRSRAQSEVARILSATP